MVAFPLASPVSFGISEVEWGPSDNISRALNPFTLQTLTQVWDGEIWEGALTFKLLGAAGGRALAAWLTSLSVHDGSGPLGTFLLGDPAHPLPAGSALTTPGTPVVSGGSQIGFSLDVSGLPAAASGYLLAGDYIQLGSGATSQLHMILEDADSDGSGDSTFSIWPALRSSPLDSDPIVVSGAVGVFIIPQNHRAWAARPPVIYEQLTVPIREYLT